jgi:hypothetical protein
MRPFLVLSALACARAAWSALPAGGASVRSAARSQRPLLRLGTEDAQPFPGFFQREVPEDQQPIVELQQLRKQPFYDWVETNDGYVEKLKTLYVALMLLVSLPVAYNTYSVFPYELPQFLLAANLGTLFVMIPFVFRLRVGWAFVSARLKEKVTYYEAEQRGLFARKDRETSLRDRLIQKRTVVPNLRRIDFSLAAMVVGLFMTVSAAEAITVIEGENGPATLKALTGDAAVQYTVKLRSDDEFARREQERAQRKADENGEGLKPAYCDSRYYKILAGGNGQGGVGCAE